jgi:hypothetical protein
MKIQQIITETVDGKNLHLEHLDDEVWNRGHQGAVEALQYLEGAAGLLLGTSDQSYFATKKWDGSPALFMGTDPETGQFVMGDKGIFSGTKENKIFQAGDVDRVKPDKVKGGEKVDYGPLRAKLKMAFNYLKDLNFGDKVLQGDLLWTQGDGDSGFKTIDGVNYWTFKPNLLTYAVPADTQLAQRMSKAKVGIVFHTTYEGGPTLQDMSARFGADISEIGSTPYVYVRDATIKDVSGSITLTQRESNMLEMAIAELWNYLSAIGEETFAWLDSSVAGHSLRDLIKIDINKMVKAGAMDQPEMYVQQFINRLNERLAADVEKLKTQAGQERKRAAQEEALKYIKQHTESIENVYLLFIGIQRVKDVLQQHYAKIRQIDTFIQRPDGSFDVKPEEGVVIVDHLGKGGKEAVKIVDRLDFSRENFTKARRR